STDNLPLLSSLTDRVHQRPIGESRVRESPHSSQDIAWAKGVLAVNAIPKHADLVADKISSHQHRRGCDAAGAAAAAASPGSGGTTSAAAAPTVAAAAPKPAALMAARMRSGSDWSFCTTATADVAAAADAAAFSFTAAPAAA
ncbi:unnamed protein product, partial [Phaeothamnion confervicola]